MSTVTTTRSIDLAAFAAELGGAALSMRDSAGQRTITCLDNAVALAALQAAVNAHTPPVPPASVQEQLDGLLLDYLDITEGQQAQIDLLILATLG